MPPAIIETASRSEGYGDGDTNTSSPLSDTFPAGRSSTVTKGTRALPKVAWLLVPLLGLFFLVYPIVALLATDPTPARMLFAFGGAALFVCVFLWLMWMHEPLQLVPAEPSEIRKYRAVIAFLAVLAGALSFTLGAEWRMLFAFHINVAAGIMLPRKDAYVTIAGIAVVTLVGGLSMGLWWLAAPVIALGLWATAFVNQVATVAELRAAREELARLAVAEERLRFARDLHDLLGHSLSLITLKHELAARLLPATPARAAKEIREAQEVAQRALREVREAVVGYRQPTLVEEIRGAEEMLEAAGIACRIEYGTGPLSKSVESVLAWTVREGVTNVMRHSRAHHCAIRLVRAAGTIRAEVSDDGRGLVPARDGAEGATGGSGLSGLAERVAGFAGADFVAGPLPEGGFRICVSLPLQDGSARKEERQ